MVEWLALNPLLFCFTILLSFVHTCLLLWYLSYPEQLYTPPSIFRPFIAKSFAAPPLLFPPLAITLPNSWILLLKQANLDAGGFDFNGCIFAIILLPMDGGVLFTRPLNSLNLLSLFTCWVEVDPLTPDVSLINEQRWRCVPMSRWQKGRVKKLPGNNGKITEATLFCGTLIAMK